MSDGGQLTARLRPAFGTARRRPVPLIKCPYCRQTFGPWGAAAIEPCRLCERPLHRSLGWARPRQVVVLLDTINACQGMAVMVADIAFVTGGVSLQRLCAWIALALFVSATAYITDGALSWKTRLCRSYRGVVTGPAARASGVAQIAFGTSALALSIAGFAYLFV